MEEKEEMIKRHIQQKTFEEAKRNEAKELESARRKERKKNTANIHTHDSSSTPDTLTDDSGALQYNVFKEKKISTYLLVPLNEQEQQKMRQYKKKEKRGNLATKQWKQMEIN